MSSILKFNRFYFVLTILLFGIEILIAKFAHDQIIRPYVGALRSHSNILLRKVVPGYTVYKNRIGGIAIFIYRGGTAIFSCCEQDGTRGSNLAKIIIGTYFEWIDLVAYTLGIAIVIYLESVSTKKKGRPNIRIA